MVIPHSKYKNTYLKYKFQHHIFVAGTKGAQRKHSRIFKAIVNHSLKKY